MLGRLKCAGVLGDLLPFDQGYLPLVWLVGGAGLAFPVAGVADDAGVGLDRNRVCRQHWFARDWRMHVQ